MDYSNSEFFKDGKCKEGVSLMWAGDGDIYFNPNLSNKIVKGEESRYFSIPIGENKGLSPKGEEIFNTFAKAFPFMEKRTMLNASLLRECDAIMWGEGITQTAKEGAYMNVSIDWETGEVYGVYIINPDEEGNPVGFMPVEDNATECNLEDVVLTLQENKD